MTSVEGKTIVISGAGSGIGQAIAKRFAQDGATVIGTDVNREGLAQLDGVQNVFTTHADVSDWAEVKASVDFAIEKTGQVDVYINNAGIAMEEAIVDTDVDRFALLHRIHVLGTLHGMKAALGPMREQGSGHILNVISRVAETDTVNMSAYASAKAAMWSMTRIGAAENADRGIVVSALFPGISRTAMTAAGGIGDPSQLGEPDQEYDTFKMLATLDPGQNDGQDNGKVWFHGQIYPMFQDDNDLGQVTGGLAEGRASQS
ncbi:MAG: SDR family NAD(P)-dependent oxidoreductase [Actinomycetales bacterium]